MTILIAEDDEYSVILLKEFLKGDNVNIYNVSNGKDAVEFCRNRAVDLVLMDIQLPGMTGIEAVKQIKKLRPKLTVIAETACGTKTEIDEIAQSGFDAYILKPFKKEDLLKLISL